MVPGKSDVYSEQWRIRTRSDAVGANAASNTEQVVHADTRRKPSIVVVDVDQAASEVVDVVEHVVVDEVQRVFGVTARGGVHESASGADHLASDSACLPQQTKARVERIASQVVGGTADTHHDPTDTLDQPAAIVHDRTEGTFDRPNGIGDDVAQILQRSNRIGDGIDDRLSEPENGREETGSEI